MQEPAGKLPPFPGSPASELNIEENATSHPWPHLLEYFTDVNLDAHQTCAQGRLLRFCLTDENDRPCSTFKEGQILRFYGECLVEKTKGIPASSITIWNNSGLPIYCKGTPFHEESPYLPPINSPSMVYAREEVKLDLTPGEYTLSFGVSEITPEVHANRHLATEEDWAGASTQLLAVTNLTSFSIVLPAMGCPSRVPHFGLVDLPGKGALSIFPLHSD